MQFTRFALLSCCLAVVVMVQAMSGRPANGQDISSTLSQTDWPSVPFLIEPVMPEPAIRLQNHLLPISVDSIVGEQSMFLWSLRLIGSFAFSERVIGEASMPVFLAFPEGSDTAFELGNPRIGLEAPILIAGGRTHRWTFAFDLFLPLAQVGEAEDAAEVADEIERRYRYALMNRVLPTMSTDFGLERLPIVVGTHYRLRTHKVIVETGIDFPFLIGLDFGGDPMFSDGEILTRYGLMLGYDVRPFYPTLEFAGVSQLSGEADNWTALMATAGFRYAYRGFEPAVAVTFPFLLEDDNLNTSVYVSLDLTYRFL